ncbi:MAG: flagellar biosynthesis repressor FlbT [Puniceicoccaceae bacterium]
MGLKLKLRANEKVYINGALLENGDSASEIQILNRVPILREKDILLEKDADTPCKRVYFVVQTLYFKPLDESSVIQLLSKLSIDIVKAAPSTAGHFDAIFNWVGKGKFYNALKEVKELIKYEETLLHYAKSIE